ncbi:hypothetical protein LR002_00070 [Candidatus Gracilibacteria bacterium]|nr:hypothetical protein [Candidatus Gracilibacteria bacterium]
MSKKSVAEKILLGFVIGGAALGTVGLAKTEKGKEITGKISKQIGKTSKEILKQIKKPENQEKAKTIWHYLNKVFVKK